MKELEKVLDDKEKVFWEGKPNFWPFFLSSFVIAIIGLVFMIAGAIPLIQGIISGNLVMVFFPHFWIGLIMVVGVPAYTALSYNHTYYAITNKRAIIQKGVIGRDFEMVDFDQITNAEVRVGFLDIVFGRRSGSIILSTAGTFTYGRHGPVQKPYTMRNIDNPYEVFKFFKKVSHAVKTDIHYPNKLRPSKNPGYSTEYDPDNK